MPAPEFTSVDVRCPGCGHDVVVTVLAQVLRRSGPVALGGTPSEPAVSRGRAKVPVAEPRRCGAKRTPTGVVSCYFDAGHPPGHSWEPKA